jgi:arabinofuranosyltransferase
MDRIRLGQQSPAFYLLLLCCAGCVFYILSNAWMHDDAYITFRVIDNFAHGYGLRWNVDERVQVYTHPLWMLLHIVPYLVFGNIYLVSMAISALCAAGAVYFLLRVPDKAPLDKILFVLLPILLITAMRNYMMCGLEAPLAMLLIGWFYYTLASNNPSPYRLAFITSLCLLTRLDYCIILAPALIWVAYTQRRNLNRMQLLKSFWPLIAWLAFSLFYYGFMLPNTKYAKLNTGIPLHVLICQGLHYVAHYVVSDPFGTCWIIAAAGLTLRQLFRGGPYNRQTIANLPKGSLMLAGLIAYIGYIIYIGGDYIEGRFFAIPTYIAIWMVYLALPRLELKTLLGTMLLVALAPNLLSMMNPLVVSKFLPKGRYAYGIHNEYAFYRPASALLLYPGGNLRVRREVNHQWGAWGKQLKEKYWHLDKTLFFHAIGMYGFYAGPKLRIIDDFAITDPLLARLPMKPHIWRVGHFMRHVPTGYFLARDKGETALMQDDLEAYYNKLHLVTSGDLLSLERLQTIIGFQLGLYDHWLQAYLRPGRR